MNTIGIHKNGRIVTHGETDLGWLVGLGSWGMGMKWVKRWVLHEKV